MKLSANKIGWIAFTVIGAVIIFSIANRSINLFDYFTGRPLRPGQGAQVVETTPYVFASNQDTSKWAIYTSPDGYSFKYPSDLVDINSPFIGPKGATISQVRFSFKIYRDSTPEGMVDVQKSFSNGQIKVQNITIGDITGKVITGNVAGTSINAEDFIFSLSNNRTLDFLVPLNYSPIDIPHAIISTLALTK